MHPSQLDTVFRAALQADVPFAKLVGFLRAVGSSGLSVEQVIDALSRSTA